MPSMSTSDKTYNYVKAILGGIQEKNKSRDLLAYMFRYQHCDC
jgi:hypothetical protein